MKLRRWFCGLAAAAFLAASPVGAEIADSVNVKTTEFDLPNGLHVILCEDHSLPRVAVNTLYKVGSSDESRGRTGFAHLFEHLMFCASGHVNRERFTELVEGVGGVSNACTMADYTDYYIIVPSEALPLALYLESDRMGYFLDGLHKNIVDDQRGVVKNEVNGQLNRPYGAIEFTVPSLLYPEGHPYSWPVGGSIEDLTAAAYADVVRFFKDHYTPGNASMAVVGDFDSAEARKMVEHWFSDVSERRALPRPEPSAPARLNGVVKKTLTDKKAKRSFRSILWHSPAQYLEGDAACGVLARILAGSAYSRLNKRLEYDLKIADMVSSAQIGQRLSSFFRVSFWARPGHTLDEIQAVVDEEIARISLEPPAPREIELAVRSIERDYYNSLQSFNALAYRLNYYYCGTGEANFFNRDLERYRRVTPREVSSCAERWLRRDQRAELTIVPDSGTSSRKCAANGGLKEARP